MFGGNKELEQIQKQQQRQSFSKQQSRSKTQREQLNELLNKQRPRKPVKVNCVGCLAVVIFLWMFLSLLGISKFTY